MNEALLKQIDQEIEHVREALARDIIHLIGIRSVRGEPEPGAPFGPGPRAMLDAVVKLGEREGFVPTRYTDSVISIARISARLIILTVLLIFLVSFQLFCKQKTANLGETPTFTAKGKQKPNA